MMKGNMVLEVVIVVVLFNTGVILHLWEGLITTLLFKIRGFSHCSYVLGQEIYSYQEAVIYRYL